MVGKKSLSGLGQTPLQCVSPSAPRCRGFQFDDRILCRGRTNDQSLRGRGGTFQGAAGSLFVLGFDAKTREDSVRASPAEKEFSF